MQTEINLQEFTSVYFRRPNTPIFFNGELSKGENDFVRSELLFTLEGIYKLLRRVYWISPIYSIREAENKIYQIEIAKSLGFMVPSSLITNRSQIAEGFYASLNQNCIVKPIKTGLIEDEKESKIIFTSKINHFYENSSRISTCPTYFQEFIEKQFDIRVTMVGEKAFVAMINSQQNIETRIDWRKGELSLQHSEYELPKHIIKKCIRLLKTLNLKFGAIDFVLDQKGNYIFLEINPNGQWAWIEKKLGYNISDEIVNLLINENF